MQRQNSALDSVDKAYRERGCVSILVYTSITNTITSVAALDWVVPLSTPLVDRMLCLQFRILYSGPCVGNVVCFQRKLEKDMQEKSYALGLDTEAVQASEDRAPTPFYVPPSTVGVPMTMGSWVKATEENCLLADRCIQNGERMRHLSNIKMQEHKAAEHKAVKAALLELR